MQVKNRSSINWTNCFVLSRAGAVCCGVFEVKVHWFELIPSSNLQINLILSARLTPPAQGQSHLLEDNVTSRFSTFEWKVDLRLTVTFVSWKLLNFKLRYPFCKCVFKRIFPWPENSFVGKIKRPKLGSLLNDHEIFNWLTLHDQYMQEAFVARPPRSQQNSLQISRLWMIFENHSLSFSSVIEKCTWICQRKLLGQAMEQCVLHAMKFPHILRRRRNLGCSVDWFWALFFSFHDRCTQFSEYLSLHVDIDVIFSTTTRWVATVQSVLPTAVVLQFVTQLQFCISERQASFTYPSLKRTKGLGPGFLLVPPYVGEPPFAFTQCGEAGSSRNFLIGSLKLIC